MNKKPTVTIGIPAYNEEANIGNLLESLLKQKQDNFVLEKIIVVSDGSIDGTNSVVERIKDKKVKLIKGRRRMGQNIRQNQILNLFDSDIVIFLEADLYTESHYVSNLVAHMVNKKSSFVFGITYPINSNNLFENVMSFIEIQKRKLFLDIKPNGSIYLCHGGKALIRDFAKKFRWPFDVPEDAYIYLYCKNNKIDMSFCFQSKAFFRSPASLKDYFKKTNRFNKGIKQLHKYFSKDLIDKEYKIPRIMSLSFLFKSFINKPFYVLIYIISHMLSKSIRMKKKTFNHLWDISLSTKNVTSTHAYE